MAHVQRRQRAGRTKWRARYRSPDGTERSKTFDRKLDAERWLASVETAKAQGSWVDPAAGRITLEEWSVRWLATLGHLKPKTVEGYRSILRSRVLPEFGPAPLHRLSPMSIQTWVSAMASEGLSPSRIRQCVHVLRPMLAAAVAEGRLARNPASHITLPRLPQTEMPFLTPDQLADVLDHTAPHYRLPLTTLAITGLRYGELAALRIGRCDLETSRLIVAEAVVTVGGRLVYGAPKSHQHREVALPGFLRDLLAHHIADRAPDQLVFEDHRGGPLRYRYVLRSIWHRALEAAGVAPAGLHALRHTAATLLIAQGAHPKAIQSHLGHVSITVTLDRYGHLLPDQADDLARRLDEAYRSSLTTHVPEVGVAQPPPPARPRPHRGPDGPAGDRGPSSPDRRDPS